MIYGIKIYIKIVMQLIPYDLLEYKTPLSFSFCHVCTIFRIKEENSITNEVEYNTSVNIHSLVVQMAKGLPAMWETLVRFLGWEDPLEKEVAITPVFLPGESHGQRSLVGYSPRGHKEWDTTE